MPIILIICQHCGTLFEARRNTARFCSDRCRAAASYLKDPVGPDADALEKTTDFDTPAALDALLQKWGLADRSENNNRLRWKKVDGVTYKLTDGHSKRQTGPLGQAGWTATPAFAYAIDKGHPYGVISWHAVRGRNSIGPSLIRAAGLANEVGPAEVKMVAAAMATGDLYDLILAARSAGNVTKDMRLSLLTLLRLIAIAHRGGRFGVNWSNARIDKFRLRNPVRGVR